MHLTPKQIEEILAKKPENRYKYFIKTVFEEEEVWGLTDDEGWLMLEVEGEKQDALAVFPAAQFAEIFQKAGDFADMRVEALDLFEFMEWLDDMEGEQLKVAVFPTPSFQSAVMRPAVMIEDLEELFDKEEGE